MSANGSSLDRLVAWSRAALAWEAVWRGVSACTAVICLFLAASWFGLWTVVPPMARLAGVIVFAALFALAAWRAIVSARLSRADALARIDRTSGEPHRIATALGDHLANSGADPATTALWRLHLARLEARLSRVAVAPPSPRAVDYDHFAWRAGALLAALAAFVAAGPERGPRVAAAFAWRPVAVATAASRIDAWIDPPAYTGKPPIMMTGQPETDSRDGRRFTAPVGSIVTVRAPADAGEVKAEGGLAEQKAADPKAPDQKDQTAGRPDSDRKFALKSDGRLLIGREAYELKSIPDNPPMIELLEQPIANLRGSLTLAYRIDDDYGAIGAEARFAAPEIEGRRPTGRPLVEAPRVTLGLPPGPNGLGEGRTTADLSEHPWGGARVVMTLHARDEGGGEGASAPIAIYLPQRNFTKPVARALVEQRRNLVLEPDRRERVQSALQALMIEPEIFGTSAGVYLGLRTASARLRQARTDAALVDVADYLWSMALQIEDGGLSDAERDMRAAEQQLREALQRNAPEEEIRKLTEALRAAMDKFLSEMAQQQRGEQEQADRSPDRNSRAITRDDLKNMLDRMEEMARSGDVADAQRMLDQLQNMLENLRTARKNGPRDRAAQQKQRQLGEMDKLMREQQQLRDDTYRDSRRSPADRREQQQREGQQSRRGDRADPQGQRRGQQQGDRQQQGDKQGQDRSGGDDRGDLRRRQQQLRDRLGEIERNLGPHGQESQQALEAAREAMNDADAELGQGGDREKAVDAQGRALDALRSGADKLAKEMQRDGDPSDQVGEGEGPGMGEPDGGAPDEADPLGRPSSRDPRINPRAKYDPLGVSPARRAQRVLEELRRRLGDVSRPQEELDYLERLIRRY